MGETMPEGITWVSAVRKSCLAAIYLRQRSLQCTDALQGLGDRQQAFCFLQKKDKGKCTLMGVQRKMEVKWTEYVSKVRKVWWHQLKAVCIALGEDAGTCFICQRGSCLLRHCFTLSFSHTLRPQASRLPVKITTARFLVELLTNLNDQRLKPGSHRRILATNDSQLLTIVIKFYLWWNFVRRFDAQSCSVASPSTTIKSKTMCAEPDDAISETTSNQYLLNTHSLLFFSISFSRKAMIKIEEID